MENYNILLIRIDTTKPTKPGQEIPIKKQYTIATATTEAEALKTSQFYSKLYQEKGLYNLLYKPTHIVTYCKA